MLIALFWRQITITPTNYHLCNIFPHFILILQSLKEILGGLSCSSSYSTVCISEQCEPGSELLPGVRLWIMIQAEVKMFSLVREQKWIRRRCLALISVQLQKESLVPSFCSPIVHTESPTSVCRQSANSAGGMGQKWWFTLCLGNIKTSESKRQAVLENFCATLAAVIDRTAMTDSTENFSNCSKTIPPQKPPYQEG